jgi:uncharacterized RDD family membrane protein YckC
MTVRTLRTLLVWGLLTAVPGGALAAQSTPQPRPEPAPPPVEAPAPQPPVEAPTVQPPLESADDTGRRLRRPVVRMMQDFTLRADEAVPYVTVVLGDAVIEGHVHGDVVVILGSARLVGAPIIEGSLIVVGGSVHAGADARVGRELVVVGGTLNAPATFSAYGDQVIVGAPWLGDILRDVSPWFTRGLLLGRMIVPNLEWIWTIVIVFFLIYLALNTVFDRAVAASADVMVARPLGAFLAGLLVLLLAVPVLAIVAATVIGLAIFPFLICGLIVAVLIGKTAVARAMGRGVLRTESPEGRIAALVAFVIGFALLTLAYMVPLLGFVTWAMTTVLGLGAATIAGRGHLRREKRASAPPPAPLSPSYPPEAVAATARAQAIPVVAPSPDVLQEAAPPVAVEVPPIPPPPPPPPIYTRGLAVYPRATFLDRLAAFILDCILVAVAGAILDFDTRGSDENWFWFLLLAYHIAFWAWKGTTLGGIVCNLKVTRTDGAELRFQDALVRGLSGILSIAALGIGFFWMLQDPERQTWHDKIAGTLVVKAPREVVLP